MFSRRSLCLVCRILNKRLLAWRISKPPDFHYRTDYDIEDGEIPNAYSIVHVASCCIRAVWFCDSGRGCRSFYCRFHVGKQFVCGSDILQLKCDVVRRLVKLAAECFKVFNRVDVAQHGCAPLLNQIPGRRINVRDSCAHIGCMQRVRSSPADARNGGLP